jgi:hypothetical protein
MHMSFNDELQKTSLILRGGDVEFLDAWVVNMWAQFVQLC